MESGFEVWQAGFKLGGLIEGLEGRFEVWGADLGHGGADLNLPCYSMGILHFS